MNTLGLTPSSGPTLGDPMSMGTSLQQIGHGPVLSRDVCFTIAHPSIISMLKRTLNHHGVVYPLSFPHQVTVVFMAKSALSWLHG